MLSSFFMRAILWSVLGAAIPVFGGPLIERAEVSERGGAAATVQWSNSAGNHLRTYHIRSDCTVVENSWGPGFTAWIANPLPYCADPIRGIVATVIPGPDGSPELIQLFFADNGNANARSGLWQSSSLSWTHDQAFNSMEIPHKPGAVVSWRTSPSNVQIRLYMYNFISPPRSGVQSDVFEYSFVRGTGWIVPPGGRALFSSKAALSSAGITAVMAGTPGWIRVFYWDRDADPNIFVKNGRFYVREALWTASTGWRVLGSPRPELESGSGFDSVFPLSAIAWDNGNQMRLYIKFRTSADTVLFREWVYTSGTWYEPNTLPGWATDRVLLWSEVGAVVWMYPNVHNVHIRLFNARCHYSGSCRPYIHEIGFDTGVGWYDAKDLSA